MLLITVALAAVAVLAVAALLQRSATPSQLSQADRAELIRLRRLVDDLKELAWDHREIDPDLSTIVIDTIRNSDRGGGNELG